MLMLTLGYEQCRGSSCACEKITREREESRHKTKQVHSRPCHDVTYIRERGRERGRGNPQYKDTGVRSGVGGGEGGLCTVQGYG